MKMSRLFPIVMVAALAASCASSRYGYMHGHNHDNCECSCHGVAHDRAGNHMGGENTYSTYESDDADQTDYVEQPQPEYRETIVTDDRNAELDAYVPEALPADYERPVDSVACPAFIVEDGVYGVNIPADIRDSGKEVWTFIRYDIDGAGTPHNLRVERSSGLSIWDSLMVETLSTRRFDMKGADSAEDCVQLMQLANR